MTPKMNLWRTVGKLVSRSWTRVPAVILAAILAAAGILPVSNVYAASPLPLFTHGTPVGGKFVPGVTLNWLFFFSNSDGVGQSDNPGDEIVVVLPPQVQLISATYAGQGVLVVDVPTNTVTVNLAIGGFDLRLLEIVSQIKPGTEGQVVIGSGTMNFDADTNGTNETSKTVFAAPFTVAGSSAAGPTPASTGQDAAGRERDRDEPPRLSRQERRERERTNRLGEGDYALEGNVVAVRTDLEPPEIVVANRDGDVRVILQCGANCPTLRVGDYVSAAGTKEHELLFYAEDVSVERR